MMFSDPESARSINRLRILNTILSSGSTSRAELARTLHLNKMSVSAIVTELLESSYIIESGKNSGASGRRSITLEIDRGKGIIIAVDAGLFELRIAAVDCRGDIIRQTVLTPPDDHTAERFVSLLTQEISTLLQGMDGSTPVLGTALAFGGVIDRQQGSVLFSPNWDWHDEPIAEKLSSSLGHETVIDNNVRTMLLAESWFTDTDSEKTLFYINWAEGIGSALSSGGVILPIHSEFGHLHVSETRTCSCGKVGCLQAHASGRILTETGNRAAGTNGKSIPELLRTCPEMHRLCEHASVCMGRGISSVVNILSPDEIVIGGGLSDLEDYYFDILQQECRKHSMSALQDGLRIRKSRLGSRAGILGAAALGMDRFIYQRQFLRALERTKLG